MYSAISNQYQTNFQGNLYKTGLKLPQKKFNEVARIFEQKTKGLPDVTLEGKRNNNNDFFGLFYYTVDYSVDGVKKIGEAFRPQFDEFFAQSAPKQIANKLANVIKYHYKEAKISSLHDKLVELTKQYEQ